MNVEFDQHVLAHLQARNLRAFDDWDQAELMGSAGVGSLEVHTWIAATAAFGQADAETPIESYYAPIIEYGGGYGMLYSRLSADV